MLVIFMRLRVLDANLVSFLSISVLRTVGLEYFLCFWELFGRLWDTFLRYFGVLEGSWDVFGCLWATVWDDGVAFGAYVGQSPLFWDPFLVYFGVRKIMKNLCFT